MVGFEGTIREMTDGLNKLAECAAATVVCLCLLCGCQALSPNSFITSLKPIQVYHHRGNLVVAQKVVDGVEYGKYITSSLSSYMPMDGDDGFTFTAGTSLVNRKGLALEYRLGEIYGYERNQPAGGANGRQPSRSEGTNTSPAAASRR